MRRAALLFLLVGGSGCVFVSLRAEIDHLKRNAWVSGQVEGVNPTGPPVYVAHVVGGDIRSAHRLVPTVPQYGFLVKVVETNDVVAFQDLDGNQRWNDGEPVGRLTALGGRTPTGRTADDLPALKLVAGAVPGMLLDFSNLPAVPRGSFGEVVSLNDPRYDDGRVSGGMWQPLTSAMRGGYGIQFLAPHDPKKVPVLFIHGIAGSPRNFEAMIERLDRTRYEPWLAYYPSGIRLPVLASVLASSLARARADLKLERVVVVAHSMGGLVARGALLELAEREDASFISLFVSFSTPWAGHAAAAEGLDSAPQAVPSWVDLAPGSIYLKRLERPLPMPFHLFFGVGERGSRLDANNDGVVAVASELAPFAQRQAVRLWGFDAGHMGILRSAEAFADFSRLLDASTQTPTAATVTAPP